MANGKVFINGAPQANAAVFASDAFGIQLGDAVFTDFYGSYSITTLQPYITASFQGEKETKLAGPVTDFYLNVYLDPLNGQEVTITAPADPGSTTAAVAVIALVTVSLLMYFFLNK
jgi:hypothetical protein